MTYEAKRRGMKTSAHTPYALTIVQAADAGLSSVEHVDYLIKAGSPKEAEIGAEYVAGKLTYGQASDAFVDSFDKDYARGVYRELAKGGIAVTPTLLQRCITRMQSICKSLKASPPSAGKRCARALPISSGPFPTPTRLR